MARLLRWDFSIGGKGYILSRASGVNRAWSRRGQPDTPVRTLNRDEAAAQYGGVDPQIDYPEVWDDWSGGYGQAYREPNAPNTYHWSENFDARFPKQLVHAQLPKVLRDATASDSLLGTGNMGQLTEGVDAFVDVNLLDNSWRQGGGLLALLGVNGRVPMMPNASTWIAQAPAQYDASHYGNMHPAVIYGDYYYWGRPETTYFTASKLAADTVVSAPGYRFAVAGNQLWRAHGSSADLAYYLQNCGNPNGTWTLANWGATYNIGNYRAPIQDLIAVDDQVFAGTPDGLYAGDETGTFVNVFSELRLQAHPDNCRDLTIFEGAVVAPHIAGIFSYRPSTGQIEDMSPPRADRSPVIGNVRSLKSYGRWLYAGLYTGSRSWLLAGERKQQGIAWHTLHRLAHSTKISRIHIDGLTSYSLTTKLPNHFWIATEASIDTSGTSPTYWWNIPTLDGNPLAPSPAFSANYVGSARIDMGSVDWGAPGTAKVYRSFELWSESLASGAQWANVYYQIDEGTRTLLGTIAKSPKDQLFFSSGEGSFVTGQSIRMSIESFTASAGVTPVYRTMVLRGALQPRYTDEIQATIRIADNMLDRQGQAMRSAATQLQELRDFGNPDRQGLQGHQLIDLSGATWMVKVLGPPEEREAWMGQGDDTPPEVAATIRMSILTYTGA